MKLEEPLYFGWYEMSQYAEAKVKRRYLEDYHHEQVQEMYEDISPTRTHWCHDTGNITIGGQSVEDIAINIASFKERYEKMITKLKRREEVFEVAMSELSPRERDVIKVQYHGSTKHLGLCPEYFAEILKQAEEKLCIHLYAAKKEELREKEREHQEELKRKREMIQQMTPRELKVYLQRDKYSKIS